VVVGQELALRRAGGGAEVAALTRRQWRGAEVLASLRPAWVGVDLDQLEANLRALRTALPAGCRTLAVIKADAYGHGAPAVARILERAGVDWLGVALVEEGVEVRLAGVETPILVLGTAHPAQLPAFSRHRLTPTISSREQLAMWRAWTVGAAGRQAVHLKVDTGMGRLGVPLAELGEVLAELRASPGLELRGLLSHLAAADDLGNERNPLQIQRFESALGLLSAAEREQVVVHLANSAGALHHPDTRHDLVRLGLALYGLDPAETGGSTPAVRQAMSLTAHVVSLRDIAPGSRIGYGARWTAPRPSRVAVVPVGYADGYPWRLTTGVASQAVEALVGGRRTEVVGAVSMDMTFVDVTGLAVEIGDPVTLMGREGGEEITARDLAAAAGTIPWEVLCLLGLRLPRRYLREGETVEVLTRFHVPELGA
jgi:alanine racemase